VRFARRDVRGPYQIPQNRLLTLVSILKTLRWLNSPTCIICEIFEVPRFSSFSTKSARSGHTQGFDYLGFQDQASGPWLFRALPALLLLPGLPNILIDLASVGNSVLSLPG
jgi:hypothetical protein